MIKIATASIFIFFVLNAFPLFAQEPATDSVDEVTVVSGAYIAGENTPMTYQNLSTIQFEHKNVGQEPSFLLSQLTPSVTVYSDAGSYQGYSYFRLRGIDQTRINMTLNGVPLNEPEDQGAYFSNYPDFFNSVSKVQIQRGVGISQNGTASYGGSIQLFSPTLTDSTKASVGLGYGSFNSYRAYAEYQSGLRKNKAFYIRGSHLHSNGYKHHSGNTSQSIFYSGGLFSQKHSLSLSGFVGHQQNKMAWLGVSDSLLAIDRRHNANAEQENDQFLQSLTMLQHRFYPSAHSQLSTSVYYNVLSGNYDFDVNNFLGLPSTYELFNYAFLSHFVGLYSNYSIQIQKLNLNAGIHANWYTRRHTGSEKTWGELYQNRGYKQEASAFVKAGYELGPFSFFADLQFRYSSFTYKGSSNLAPMQWKFFNPKGGIVWHPKKRADVYYSIGRVGREPTRTDILGGSDDLLVDSFGHPILGITQAEYVLDQELGYRQQGRNWELGANLFWMQFSNEIVLNGKFGPNGLALNNAFAKSFRTGIELQAVWRPIAGLELAHNSSFNYSRIREQGQTFSPIYTPFLLINQEVSYRIKGWYAAINARYQSRSFIDFANTVQLKDYVLLNAQIGYNIQGWQFSFMVNNVLNTKYYNQGYIDWDGTAKYFAQAPLNIYGTVTFSF